MARKQYRIDGRDHAVRVGLRMPEDLKRAISLLAFDQGRSENAVMVEALQRYVENQNAAQSKDQAARRTPSAGTNQPEAPSL